MYLFVKFYNDSEHLQEVRSEWFFCGAHLLIFLNNKHRCRQFDKDDTFVAGSTTHIIITCFWTIAGGSIRMVLVTYLQFTNISEQILPLHAVQSTWFLCGTFKNIYTHIYICSCFICNIYLFIYLFVNFSEPLQALQSGWCFCGLYLH